MAIRILLVDDHELLRQGVRMLLEENPAFMVCGEAENGKEAVAKVLELKPDVVVMDISMPVMNGIDAVKLIRLQCSLTKIVMLTTHHHSLLAQEAMRAGANGFVHKSETADELRKAIMAVLEAPKVNYARL